MAFDTLSAELQNIILVNHSYITKWFVFLCIIFLSIYYITVIWKEQAQTKFITNFILRIFFFGLSVVYLVTSPLMILLMSPEYDFYSFYTVPLIIYGIFTTLIFILLFVDFIRYGLIVMLRMAGLNIGDKNANEIANWIENNKHFLKLGWDKKRMFKRNR